MARDSNRQHAEVEMWEVLDQAIDEIPAHVPLVDAAAMRLSMTLHVASRVVTMDLRSRLQRDGELTPAQLNVLLFTLVHGELELHRITTYVSMKKATASALVNDMVNAGLLQRRFPTENRRTILISVTDEGEAIFKESFQIYNDGERRWAAALDAEERDQLVKLLVKLVNSGVTGT